MNAAVVLEVHMESIPGREQELENELQALLAPTREEPGCIAYELHRDPEDSGKFLFYEKFKDQAALSNHLDTPHFKKFVAYRAQGIDPIATVTVKKWAAID